MFSVIICSVDRKRLANVKAMYERNFQNHPWELIHIDDARSLAEGYNRGVTASRGDCLIFSHDDIEIFSPQFPERLQKHLETYDIVGLVGTSRLVGPEWIWAGPPHLFGQICHPHGTGDGNIIVNIIGAPRPVVGNIQAIDGLFIAARRSVVSKVSFDAVTFDGFHHYDLDFSYAAYRKGLRLAVANDICAFHYSAGDFGLAWSGYAEKFYSKWLNDVPRVPRRTCSHTLVVVNDRVQALEVMTPAHWLDAPPFWRQHPENKVE
jgi:GT2 family glycosyltransferase